MRVVHLSYTYGTSKGGGAAIAASRLHEALVDAGVESHFVCLLQNDPGRNVHVLPQGHFTKSVYFLLAKALRAGWKLTPFRRGLSTNLIPLPGLRRLLDEIKPDVVHVHWINYGVASQESLARLPYPIVVNLHDLWPIDALNFYPGQDRRFITGMTRQNSNWMERWMLARKRKFSQGKMVSFIGPSDWAVEMCRRSVVGRGLRAYAISNIIDAHFTYAHELVPHNERCVFLFGCDGGTGNRFKGFDEIVTSLEHVAPEDRRRMLLRVFGQESGPSEIAGVPVEYLGSDRSPEDLRRIYHQADVFLFPSKQETQGMTKIEAMLCGLPVIAFNRTACAEGLVEGTSGYIVPDGDTAAYGKAMGAALERWTDGSFDRGQIADRARRKYARAVVLNDIMHVYEESIS